MVSADMNNDPANYWNTKRIPCSTKTMAGITAVCMVCLECQAVPESKSQHVFNTDVSDVSGGYLEREREQE